jgi:hypothetical protein
MTSPRKKKRAKTLPRRKRSAKKKGAPKIATRLRAGLPASDSIRGVVDFVSPQKVRYTILKTTEMDAYDKPRVGPRKSKKNRSQR